MSYSSAMSNLQSRHARFASSFILVSIAALFLSLVWAPSALANPADGIDPDAQTELIITKLEQPAELGDPATGLPLDPDIIGVMTPIAGVTFTAKLVPGIDLTTNEGQQQAATLTASEAYRLVQDQPVADSGVTGANGVLRLGGANGKLGVGLYLIEETDTPAGIVGSAPFLVALPLTNPESLDQWLYTVYVYPKNANVEVDIAVDDADAVTCGDTVTWTTSNMIPGQAAISTYITRNVLAPGVVMDGLDGVTVTVSGGGSPSLILGDDYSLNKVSVDGQDAFDVEFTSAGRTKLVSARSANPSAQVVVSYPTRVTEIGIHTNQVLLYVDGADPVTASTTTKWGPLNILVHEKDNPSNLIPGSKFKLYLSEADARAGNNPITVAGVSEWTTDTNGRITIGCLRHSDFVNGLDVDSSDPLYRPYWAMPQSYPTGWTGDTAPLPGVVNETTPENAPTLVFQVWKGVTPPVPPTPGPKPPLPNTGVQIAGAVILGGILLVGGGILAARRRNEDENNVDGISNS